VPGVGNQRQTIGQETGDQLGEKVNGANRQGQLQTFGFIMPVQSTHLLKNTLLAKIPQEQRFKSSK
jgi:hypothetical protein